MGVYQDLGLRRVINASGRMTVLGVSTVSDRVASASVRAAQSYVVIEELMVRAGELISRHTGAEMSCVTSSASAAIALGTAALVTRGRRADMLRLPDSSGLNNQIVIQKGHVINYGAPTGSMIRLGGGVPVEVGQANEVHPEDIEQAITEKTCALFYVKSHHCVQKGMVDPETMIDIAHRNGLPLMMDCAAEEDLKKYVAMDADLVCYSGSKAIEAPTSGFITGKRDYVRHVQEQYAGIGRAMKVGKEQIVGLLEALDQYEEKDRMQEALDNDACVEWLVEEINWIPGLKAQKIRDEAGRAISRCRVSLSDPEASAFSMAQLNDELRRGDPSVWARTEFLAQGMIDFDPRPLVPGDAELIVKRLQEIVGG